VLWCCRDALDRAGMNPKTGVEIEVNPYQSIFEQMEMGGSRAAYRGEPEVIEPHDDNQRALVAMDDTIDHDWPLDVEVVDPITPDGDERQPDEHSAPEPSPFESSTPPPEAGHMTMDAAMSAAAAMNQRNATIRRAQRALPRGRS
jgi:hypothetical protein